MQQGSKIKDGLMESDENEGTRFIPYKNEKKCIIVKKFCILF
jgi:hypothetical protein